MFPNSWIHFGVLHGMAVMLVLARLLAPLRGGLWLAGALALALPALASHPFFDAPAWHWTGLVTRKPVTEDYVPVLPWLGVMWWGMAVTQWILSRRPGWLASPAAASGDNIGFVLAWPRIRQGLSLLGRWSLTFYMVHQPVMIGGLLAWMTLTGRAA